MYFSNRVCGRVGGRLCLSDGGSNIFACVESVSLVGPGSRIGLTVVEVIVYSIDVGRERFEVRILVV